MLELLDFQEKAANQIADRAISYIGAPVRVGRANAQIQVPFIQLLNSITASGKTLILADAVSAIAKHLPLKPVVIWLSKASVVVSQTYLNLDAGGAYHNLLEDFEVSTLADYDEADLTNSPNSFLFFATVGTFNQEGRGDSGLNVFKSAIDDASRSTWESLKIRPDAKGFRRPLIVVYDEAHNLSDQQTTLLLELQPDAFLLATATNRLPQRFEDDIISHLKKIGGLSDDELVTVVDPADVARSGLIKNEINLIGRQAPMDDVVAELVRDLKTTTKIARLAGVTGSPKAVYICRTNVAEDSGQSDNPKRPFAQRKAPPILIWRHLTEKLKIDPSDIVVYCDLKVDKAFPMPVDFKLLRGGDKDYSDFISGSFKHIIFNQSLQEGWDDPHIYFAYIDKSMGSKVQAEQIVGRLLRQPGRKHFRDSRLNTAQIYVRVEAAGVFDEVVESVEEKIKTGKIDIKMSATRVGRKPKSELPPKKSLSVPVTAIITDRAEKRISEFINKMSDYRKDDGTNIRGRGKRIAVQKIIGGPSGQTFEWEDFGDSASVLARWLFAREVARIHKGALGIAITSRADGTPTKFDARIGFDSPAAAHVADVAKKVGEAFVDQAYLKLRGPNPFEVGSVFVNSEELVSFKNALHKGYDDFNPFELEFAKTLDKTKLTWCRNPVRSGYSIPLPQPGKTLNFFPDFLVWKKKDVFAIDTKGSHLHADAARKLVTIKPANASKTRVFVRFVSDGLVDENGPRADSSGYTVWSFKPSGDPEFTHCESMNEALEACLQEDV